MGSSFPSLVYLVIFFALNPHLATTFSTHYSFGGADGYQNIWNLWWVDQAVRTGQNPWFTTLLHYPYGTTLIGHTLDPFNGFMAMPLMTMASLLQAYNTIVIFSFVSAGVTAAWLCFAVTGSRFGSLVGGAVFTFSSFHFMHADGHLQLTAVQWVPLFVLCWIRFCSQPSITRGLIAAGVLTLVILCDLYYFAYCVFAAALFYGYTAWQRRDWRFVARERGWMPVIWTVVAILSTCGVLAGALVYQHATDPLFGTHSPLLLSMDLLSPFVWGFYWRFRDSVTALWKPLSLYPTEASVHLGLSVIALCWYSLAPAPSRDRGPCRVLASGGGVFRRHGARAEPANWRTRDQPRDDPLHGPRQRQLAGVAVRVAVGGVSAVATGRRARANDGDGAIGGRGATQRAALRSSNPGVHGVTGCSQRSSRLSRSNTSGAAAFDRSCRAALCPQARRTT